MHGPKSGGATWEMGDKKKRDTATQERGGAAGGAGEAGGGRQQQQAPSGHEGPRLAWGADGATAEAWL
eukprot:6039447-Pyramimonas_sp.AAC.1